MTIDGEDTEVVVDDWFPFYVDSSNNESFCFARKKGKNLKEKEETNEIWVMLLEKAWAKVCGSFEAAEMGTADEAFNNIDGTPTQNFIINQIEKQGQEAFLWKTLQEADAKNYPISCQVDSNVRCNNETLNRFGLCDFHSYTVLRCMAVKLTPNSSTVRYMLQLRNPWGKKEWKGPWSDHSDTWKKFPYVLQQIEESDPKKKEKQLEEVKRTCETHDEEDCNDGRFWILYKDFFQFFYALTVNYTKPEFHHTHMSDVCSDEKWQACVLRIPKDTELGFLSIYQMN
jgi:hypothetical protein